MIKQTHSTRVPAIFDVLLLMGYCAFIFWLSAQPKLPAPMLFSWNDKLYHSAAYFIFGIAAWRCCRHFTPSVRAQLLIALIASSWYGISDEWHQSLVPGRSPSVGDWLADTVGAAAAMLAVKFKCIGGARFID
ncbi:MAG: VanZ family protein [Gammaproteobacteria bacterium]